VSRPVTMGDPRRVPHLPPALLLALLGAVAGCGVPLDAPLGQAVINTCSTSSDCGSDATCTQGKCVAVSYDLGGLLLQVSPLAGATFGAGTSYVIDVGATNVPLVSVVGSTQPFLTGRDIDLSPPVSIKGGQVLLDPTTILDHNCNFPDLSVPAQLTFYRVPQLAGLPFDPVQVSTTPVTPAGNTYAYDVALVSDASDRYDVYIQPQAVPGCPTVIPPYFLPNQTIAAGSGVWQLPPVATLTATIEGLTSTTSWEIDVAEPSRGLPISAGSKLQYTIGSAGVTATAQIYAINPAAWPIFRLTPVDATQSVDPTRPTVYWDLQTVEGTDTNPKVGYTLEGLGITPISVQGQVLDPSEGTGVGARLSIQSSSLEGVNAQSAAFSADAVQTESTGRFSIGLPPGDYAVRVFPTADTGLSITDGTINWPTNMSAVDCVCGIPFELARRATVGGSITTSDGRVLSGATVGITPSQPPATQYLKSTHSLGPLQPRVETTTTDASGGFSLLADLGNVDLTVQTDPATNLPWLVIPQISPVAGTTPTPLALTSPAFLTGTVKDPLGNPVANAEIDAWYPVQSVIDPMKQIVVKIATTSTDASGAYTLVLPSSVSSSGLK
jgi:hypothetical protein